MSYLENGNENILHVLEDKCYICEREKAHFADSYKKEALKQHSIKVQEKFDSFWEACKSELINTKLIKEWVKYLDTTIDKISVDRYSDFDMCTLSDNDTFFERIPNLPLFIHYHRKHFECSKETSLEEVITYLLSVKQILEKFDKTLPLEDLNTAIIFFKEFYFIYPHEGWDNYAVKCYRENQEKNNYESDITVEPIFKKISARNFLDPHYYLLQELKIQKTIEECTFEFPLTDISLKLGDYEQPLRIFLCPICEKLVSSSNCMGKSKIYIYSEKLKI